MVAATVPYAQDPTVLDHTHRASRKQLLAALQLLAKATDRRSSLAVLADLAFSVQRGRQQITATDLNSSITYLGPAADWAIGGVTVNAKLIADMVKSASGEDVALTKSGSGLTVSSNGADTTVLGTNRYHDFPKIPAIPDELVAIDGEAFGEAMERCLHAVCKDQTRFHLNGVLVEARGTSHRFVATDGHRLIKVTEDTERTFTGTGILQEPAAKILVKLLSLGKARMAIVKMMLHVHVEHPTSGEEWEASFKLIDAQFPPYDQVIPTDYERLATVDRKRLVAAMKRAKALCTETRGCKLSVSSGKLVITSDHPDNGSTSEALKADSAWLETFGGVQDFGINARYLLEALEQIECEHVTLAFGAPSEHGATKGEMLGPIVVRGTDDAVNYSVTTSRMVEVIMPMRI